MPVSPTYPGVYIEEISSGVRTITGVATSITAFIGRAKRGECNQAKIINSFGDFEREFGGLWLNSSLGYAVRDFYLNGGSQAVIVRLFHDTQAAAKTVADAVKAATDLAAAKTAATQALKKVGGAKEAITAAQIVVNAVNGLSNTATTNDIASVVDQAASDVVSPMKQSYDIAITAAKIVADAAKAATDLAATKTAAAEAFEIIQKVGGTEQAKAAAQIVVDAVNSLISATKEEIASTVDQAASDAVLPPKQSYDTVEAAAKIVADAVKAATDLAAAKTAADAALKKVGDVGEAKAAAQIVVDAVNNLPSATKEEIASTVDQAVEKIPRAKAKLYFGTMKLEAANEGRWGANLRAEVDLDNIPVDNPNLFNLTVRDTAPGGAVERFVNLSADVTDPRCASKVLEAESKLVRWDGIFGADGTPDINAMVDKVTAAQKTYVLAKAVREKAENTGQLKDEKDLESSALKQYEQTTKEMLDSVSDGSELTINDFLPDNGETAKMGLYALEQVDLFNLLCIPPYKSAGSTLDVDMNLLAAATSYCERRRAMLLVDAPKNWNDKSKAREEFTNPDNALPRSRNAALYFPRLKQQNPLRDNQVEEFVPCGAVAGVFARTDTQRGIWKAPAGMDATLVGVPELKQNLTDAENGELNPLGINCLRAFPVTGRVVWGARTLRGADQLADEYKYIPVRRLALFIEESLYRGTQWVVFEPNDEPLWAQIRLNIGAFMNNLFRQGAFQGRTPREAYFVKCDKETTTQNDINLGIVNIVVGFAPLKPAEFVIIQLQQMAGQIQV